MNTPTQSSPAHHGDPYDDAFASAVDRIARRPLLRRELLWLRAMSKDDLDTARDLESLEPGLRIMMERSRTVLADRGVDPENVTAMQAGYARLFDEHFAQLIIEVAGSRG